MDIDIVLRVLMFLATLAGSASALFTISTGSRTKLRDEYRFAYEFLKNLKSHDDLHPLVVEKGYQALAGSRSLKASEGKYLLSLRNAPDAFRDYDQAKKYLDHAPLAGEAEITFKKKYRSEWSRKWRRWVYFSLYIFFLSIAAGPIFFPAEILRSTRFQDSGVPLILTSAVFGLCYAMLVLRANMRLARTVRLVANQQKT